MIPKSGHRFSEKDHAHLTRAPTSHCEPRRNAMFNTASVSSPDGGRGRLGERYSLICARWIAWLAVTIKPRVAPFGARLPVLVDELTDALTAWYISLVSTILR